MNYDWLQRELAPAILIRAVDLMGIIEEKGERNNPVILGWAKELGIDWYKEDSIPWCGLFMAICSLKAKQEIPKDPLKALSWSNWGKGVKDAMLGDVLVFTRKGGGHVGLYVGEDKDCYHVLGGNQSDSVNVTRIQKTRLHSVRRTPWLICKPPNVRKVYLTPGGKVSQNEV